MDKETANAIAKIAKTKEVAIIMLFGSSIKIQKSGELTDIDIGVILSPYKKEVARRLEVCLPKKFDVVILNEAPLDVAYRALKEGKVVFKREGINITKEVFPIAKKIMINRSVLDFFGAI